jgi:beta-lactamase regulating signal transducer with metallopeptidase domain
MATSSQLRRWLSPVAPYLIGAYFVGVVMMVFRLATGLWGGHKLRRSATLVNDAELLTMIKRQVQRIGLKVAPAVALSQQISIPIVVGVFQPMVLLPAASVSGLTPDQLQALVLHELAHIRRYDLLVNLFQRLIEAVLFFHPAVWFISRRVSIERENAADDIVVAAGWQRVEYADALVRMAEFSSALRTTRITNQAAALAASGTNATDFKRRVLRLLEKPDTPRLRLTRGGMLAMVLVVTSLLAMPGVVQSWVDAPPINSPLSLTAGEDVAVEDGHVANENGKAAVQLRLHDHYGQRITTVVDQIQSGWRG